MGYDDTDSTSPGQPGEDVPTEAGAGGATRRVVLAAAGGVSIAALTGCATYGDTSGDSVDPPAGNVAAGTTDAAGKTGAAGGVVLAKTTDIPVGGGKILGDQKIVITQPAQGTIKAFTAICTHLGCTVADVSNGTINCTCHGSKFKIADGTVANGPAQKALAPIAVTVDGTDIKKGG